ncbi:TPA: hypothetical protein VDV70_004268 [Pseudomonas aeruginosa]|nr:hypothetical protein [Pseudomonas aeruginosa]HBN8639325.1 hypothetical protein [Pseudomonas aeruginosa]HBN9350696.1 hypothetical protein [Pseudomonas aeruginosa]HBN9351976.1 hypothetical protein [Pseudomonas aeruginosa]HCI2807289.1 hypothetical protein [Pseudomonas aeruginosa]
MARSSSNNKLYFEEIQNKNCELIKSVIRKIPSGVKFKNRTSFIKYLASYLPIHWTSLSRAKPYRDLIEEYYPVYAEYLENIRFPKPVSDQIQRLELQISNISSENRRLKAFLKSRNIPADNNIQDREPNSFLREFDVTCRALEKLLAYTRKIGIELVDSGNVLDFNSVTSATVEIILPPELTKYFREWQMRTSKLLEQPSNT